MGRKSSLSNTFSRASPRSPRLGECFCLQALAYGLYGAVVCRGIFVGLGAVVLAKFRQTRPRPKARLRTLSRRRSLDDTLAWRDDTLARRAVDRTFGLRRVLRDTRTDPVGAVCRERNTP